MVKFKNSKNSLKTLDSKLAEPLSADSVPPNLHQDIMLRVEQSREGACSGQAGSFVRKSKTHRSVWILLGSGALACCVALVLWLQSSTDLGDSSSVPQLVKTPLSDEVKGTQYESAALTALTQPNASKEIYEKEVAGLVDFLGANTQLLFSRHDLMKKGE